MIIDGKQIYLYGDTQNSAPLTAPGGSGAPGGIFR